MSEQHLAICVQHKAGFPGGEMVPAFCICPELRAAVEELKSDAKYLCERDHAFECCAAHLFALTVAHREGEKCLICRLVKDEVDRSVHSGPPSADKADPDLKNIIKTSPFNPYPKES